jgi:hypothetical protein
MFQLLQTAERALKPCIKPESMDQINFLGNAPIALYKYKYPHAVQESTGAVGAKVCNAYSCLKN